jgi:hypothetical protein
VSASTDAAKGTTQRGRGRIKGVKSWSTIPTALGHVGHSEFETEGRLQGRGDVSAWPTLTTRLEAVIVMTTG